MIRYRFSLRISAGELQKYYQGSAQTLVVNSDCGKVIHLHVRYIRPFVNLSGVQGRFELQLTDQGQFHQLLPI